MININIAKAKKANGEYSLFISFPYDNKIVEVIREFPSRFWDKDKKEWELPFNKLGEFVSKLEEFDFNITGAYVSLEKPKAIVPADFKFKTQPFEHQIESFNYGLTNDRWLLGDEMGLGKTKQSIDIAIAKKLQKGYKHCLIICGVNGLKWNWQNEITIHSNESGYILGQYETKNGLKIGSNIQKLSDLQKGIDSYFIITNIESLRNENILNELKKMCDNGEIGMIVADEVHKMKNPSSQQGKAFLKLQAKTMIAMTGTPLMNQPFDLYIILKWLGYEKHAFYSFKKHYGVFGGYGGYECVGYRYLDELQSQLNDIMLRRLKKDVLDLPEKTHITEYVDMTAKQEQIYKEISMEIKANIDMIKASSNPLAQLIRLRQATGYTGILSSKITESAKIDRMEELVEEAISNGKQVVIFSNWTQITDIVYARLRAKYATACITGETKDSERQSYVEDFQIGRAKVIVGTIGAMGTGLTLTAGTVEIFMDEPWNRANKEQAEDRCHRVGTTENITIYTLVCKDTIDEKVHTLVENKGAMADAIVDGKITTNRAELLDFLLD